MPSEGVLWATDHNGGTTNLLPEWSNHTISSMPNPAAWKLEGIDSCVVVSLVQ